MTVKELKAALELMPETADVNISLATGQSFHGTMIETKCASSVKHNGETVVLRG
ncbi:hypothetical protein [Desulfovibrio inopinatus]|uniref:hypothetical protein n=1 Tax=Desulfovibrio inopinatus TaxID=102109 RepID=UPI00040B5E15|nr:hypothetical protein [Desulfovibrio inopinatus]